MFEPKNVSLGIAPIGWCNDDMPELGGENTFQQIVSEMALAGFTVHPALGTGLLAAALGIGVTRVAAGVHFIGDVLAGYALAALCGIGLFIGQV